jgi:hypothetical protein
MPVVTPAGRDLYSDGRPRSARLYAEALKVFPGGGTRSPEERPQGPWAEWLRRCMLSSAHSHADVAWTTEIFEAALGDLAEANLL